jgi:peptide chain release factor subunit 1
MIRKMKISLHIPKGKELPRRFLHNEVAQARNIKSKQTRQSVVDGLQKLLAAVETHGSGVAYYTDGVEVKSEPYEGRRQTYYCGREYQLPSEDKFDPTLLVVVDANEATIGSTDGDHINILWTDTSGVMGKHDAGGQSQRRFERGRAEALKRWLRIVLDALRAADRGQQILVGGPGMTKDQFINELPV